MGKLQGHLVDLGRESQTKVTAKTEVNRFSMWCNGVIILNNILF